LQACNLHPRLGKLVEATTGLVLISGPTGSGKSTTLAALIEEINTARCAARKSGCAGDRRDAHSRPKELCAPGS
jgi:hypothetical protein